MSYSSINTLPKGTSLTAVKDLVEMLGYEKCSSGFHVENMVGSYAWTATLPDISFVGVELNIYKMDNVITVDTRTRLGRSYWDLEQQNKTIKYIKRYFGGHFDTDEGKNRYFPQEDQIPSRLASELFLARWKYHNALILPQIFLFNRNMDKEFAKEKPVGFAFIDDMNPRFFANSIIIPYILGVWEKYIRASFIAFLHQGMYSNRVFKNIRLSTDDYDDILKHNASLADKLGNSLSFQRPSIIDANFKMINDKIDISGTLRKPHKIHQNNLYNLIDMLVDERNELVHRGVMVRYVTDVQIKKVINDIELAGDRIYDLFGQIYGLTLSKDF